MKLDRDSYGKVALIWVCSVSIAIIFLDIVPLKVISWPVCALMIWFVTWQTWFFHVPSRPASGDPRDVISVCDGTVVVAEKVFEEECLKRECMQISVYMNFFDVHANFWPVDGTPVHFEHHLGQHLLAVSPKSSLENEHTCTIVRMDDGTEIFFKQIAGGYARRIINYASQSGTKAVRGKQCGIIQFGSRIDLFLPLDADIKVKVGDSVRACESILARLS